MILTCIFFSLIVFAMDYATGYNIGFSRGAKAVADGTLKLISDLYPNDKQPK